MSATSCMLWLLRIFNTVSYCITETASFIGKVYDAFKIAFGAKNYILFEGNCSPYEMDKVNTTASCSAFIEWLYTPDSHTFYEWSSDENQERRNLPILSLEILHKDHVIYDLTDFLENIKVESTEGVAPSIMHLIAVWSLSSGIVLNPRSSFDARVITNTGDIVTTSIYNYSNLYRLLAGEEEEEEGGVTEEGVTVEEEEVADESGAVAEATEAAAVPATDA